MVDRDPDATPRLVVFGALGGKAAHLLVRLDDRRGVATTLCGLDGAVTARTEADERAGRVGGRPVCGNCADRLAFSRDASIVVVEPTKRRRGRQKGATMATTATERKKAPSGALLEPATYAGTDVERLKAERLTINNRISGLKTQIKRAGDDEAKLTPLRSRLEDLLGRRQLLADQIGARSNDLGEATHAEAESAALAAATAGVAAELAADAPAALEAGSLAAEGPQDEPESAPEPEPAPARRASRRPAKKRAAGSATKTTAAGSTKTSSAAKKSPAAATTKGRGSNSTGVKRSTGSRRGRSTASRSRRT